MKFTILIITLCISFFTLSQEKKSLTINRTTNAPRIDGILDDDAWQNAEEAKDFTQFRPEMGLAEKKHQKT